MDEAIKILGFFLPKGTEVLTTKGRTTKDYRVYKTSEQPIMPDMPLAVLIDGGSASASEITAGALQDLDRAVIIGGRSYGKGLVQTTRPLPFNSLLKLTIAKYYIPSGRLIQEIDYSHRNPDGTFKHKPDSLCNVFHTAHGREVRDGGGITPDIKVTFPEVNRLVYNIVRDQWAFDYATKYAAEHPTIAPAGEFEITDEIFNDFKKFIDPNKFQYDKLCETGVSLLRKTAETEGYMQPVLLVATTSYFVTMPVTGELAADAMDEMGYSRLNLSRMMEDGGTVVCPLIPWGNTGAFITATLGVTPYEYFFYMPFIWLCFVFDMLSIVTGIGLKKADGSMVTPLFKRKAS